MLVLAALGALALSMAYLARPGLVFADGQINYTGNGWVAGGCPNGAHWILSPAAGITSATLHVGNQSPITMVQNGPAANSSYAADSGPVAGDLSFSSIFVSFTGSTSGAKLKLSHCLTTSSSQSASASASASASQSASASASQSASASASGSAEGSQAGTASGSASGSAEGQQGGVQAATGSPGASTPNTAFAASLATTGPTVLFALILLGGLGVLATANVRMARRRR